MSVAEISATEDLRLELCAAVTDLQDRCLVFSAKWAAQLLVELDEPTPPVPEALVGPSSSSSTLDTTTSASISHDFAGLAPGGLGFHSPAPPARHLPIPAPSSTSASTSATAAASASPSSPPIPFSAPPRPPVPPRALLVRALFDSKEFMRAASVLRDVPVPAALLARDPALSDDPLLLFLRLYMTFLAGEKRKEEAMAEKKDPLLKAKVTNTELPALAEALSALRAQRPASVDGYILFLHGLVLKELGNRPAARATLAAAVNAAPCNWSAWQALAGLCASREDVLELPLPSHWMSSFFRVEATLELPETDGDPLLSELALLTARFQNSTHLLSREALVHYHRHDFDRARPLFQRLREAAPLRLEDLDAYSNVLFVREKASELASLAHSAAAIDKYRPQTCCIIGNYYSLRADHERAARYFWRALALDPRCVSAWLLMGHENVELRNSGAAVECYRRAVDLAPRDHRAWYGLGQSYEIMQMPSYSLYYYHRASALRPLDARVWCALADMFERLERLPDAVMCLLRAEGCGDREGVAATKLARLHLRLGETQAAAKCYERVLARLGPEGGAEEGEGGAGEKVGAGSPEGDAMEGVEGVRDARAGGGAGGAASEGAGRASEPLDAHSVEALLFLAERALATGRLAKAERHCARLLESGGAVREQAKSLLAEVRLHARAAAKKG